MIFYQNTAHSFRFESDSAAWHEKTLFFIMSIGFVIQVVDVVKYYYKLLRQMLYNLPANEKL
jgi:hypothetical protein